MIPSGGIIFPCRARAPPCAAWGFVTIAVPPVRPDVLDCPMLSPLAMTVPGIGGTWCAVRVKSRHEKSLAADMLARGFDYFLPLVKTPNPSGRNLFSYQPPPFLRGLIFASSQDKPAPGFRIPTELFYFLDAHPSEYGIIEVAPSAQRRFQCELEQIHSRIVNEEITSETFRGGFVPVLDQICEVRDGAYRGQKGKVGRMLANGNVELFTRTLGDVNPLEISPHLLEPTFLLSPDGGGPSRRRPRPFCQ
jgi:hypothetical protein